MRFLARGGTGRGDLRARSSATVAYHDACHALRAQGIAAEPRAVLGRIPGLRVVEIPDGDRCCGAAGIYNLTQPDARRRASRRRRPTAIRATGAAIVASANPGCSMQIAAGLAASARRVEVVHPVELLDRALVTSAGRSP